MSSIEVKNNKKHTKFLSLIKDVNKAFQILYIVIKSNSIAIKLKKKLI